MFDVITVGSNTIDLFVWTDSKIINLKREQWMAYPLGGKILIREFSRATGGGGTNTAATFASLGLRTAYLGKIGDDENGSFILQDLKRFGIRFIGKIGGKTGFSVILDSVAHDRTVLTYKGANDEFLFKDIDTHVLHTKWFYFSAMLGKSYETLTRLGEFARRNNIPVAFNPSSYLTKKGKKFLSALLRNVHALILNKEEAEAAIGKKSIPFLLRDLGKCGPRYVVITDGQNGAYAYDHESYYQIPARKVKVVETLGAGDAFAAGFVTGLVLKKGIEECLKLGMNNAESCIQVRGAKEGLLTKKSFGITRRDNRGILKRVAR